MQMNAHIDKVRASYKCPCCNTRLITELMYLPQYRKKSSPQTVTSTWCNKCETRSTVEYRVFKKRNGKPGLKVFKLTSGENEFTRRFRLLGWSQQQ